MAHPMSKAAQDVEIAEEAPAPANRDHPFVLQGRRHARELLMSTHRLGAMTGDKEPKSTISFAMQIVLWTAISDGVEPVEVYNALIGAMIWAICRAPEEQRQGLLTEIVKNVVEGLGNYPEMPRAENETN